jgi:hypothetical protein
MKSRRIHRDDAVFIGQLVEPGQPLHIIGILIHAVQKNHDRIVVPGVVPRRQPDHKGSINVVDSDLLLRFLCPDRLRRE